MPPKKRKAVITLEDKLNSQIYKRKLRPPKLSDEKRKNFTFKSPYPQQFTFPENIIYYISRNPAVEHDHQNLIKSCKLLFRMSRIIPIDGLETCENDQIYITENFHWEEKTLNVHEKQFFKLWICEYLIIEKVNANFATTLLKHIAKCSLKELSLQNQIITFAELQILVAGNKLKKVDFDDNVIKNGDGSITDFERIFKAIVCKNLDIRFHHEQHGIGRNTATEMGEILESQEEQCHIEIRNIPQNFNFQEFFKFLKANLINRRHRLDLYFANTISLEYKNRLEMFINEILEDEGFINEGNTDGDAVPMIFFQGQNFETRYNLVIMGYD